MVAAAPALAHDAPGVHLHAAAVIVPLLLAAACAAVVLLAAPRPQRQRVRAERREQRR
jgi:hypothetical protein